MLREDARFSMSFAAVKGLEPRTSSSHKLTRKIYFVLKESPKICLSDFLKPSNLKPNKSNSSLYDGAFFNLDDDLHSIITSPN